MISDAGKLDPCVALGAVFSLRRVVFLQRIVPGKSGPAHIGLNILSRIPVENASGNHSVALGAAIALLR